MASILWEVQFSYDQNWIILIKCFCKYIKWRTGSYMAVALGTRTTRRGAIRGFLNMGFWPGISWNLNISLAAFAIDAPLRPRGSLILIYCISIFLSSYIALWCVCAMRYDFIFLWRTCWRRNTCYTRYPSSVRYASYPHGLWITNGCTYMCYSQNKYPCG